MGTVDNRTSLHVEPMHDIADPCALHWAEVRPASALAFRFMKGASGSTARDFVSTSLHPLTLVSDHVVELLRPLSGWTTYSVEVYGKKGELIPGYHGLAVTGRCGPIDNSLSQPRVCEPPVPQGRRSRKWFGAYFDEKTWDGSDLFVPEGTAMTVVTDAVKQALLRAKITNVEFEPLTEHNNTTIPAEFL
ncbi:MAG: hypothetical protein IH986_09175 [Planctomycetes bacterium]|nr:hypothetical protein [Planctomycetota bacterium]